MTVMVAVFDRERVILANVKLFTIGYEGLSPQCFFQILHTHNVRNLVDVRAIAQSRKAGFSKSALSSACRTAGLEYSHWPQLGCPSDIRASYRVSGDWQEYTRSYLPYLASQECVIVELARLANRQPCALLCYEADANFCHRLYVANALEKHAEGRFSLCHLTRSSLPSDQPALALAGR
jgi:uncharacterized protein (DUF488 family)